MLPGENVTSSSRIAEVNSFSQTWNDAALPACGKALERLKTSKFLGGPLSEMRMQPVLERINSACTNAGILFGVGCLHPRGASAGVPIDALGLCLRAVHLRRILGAARAPIFMIIGEEAARQVAPPEMHMQIAAAAKLHAAIGQRLTYLGLPLTVLPDRALFETDAFPQVFAERKAAGPEMHLYGMLQDSVVEAMRRSEGVMFKVGWTALASTEELSKGLARRGGGCEAVFDTHSLAFQQAAYGKQLIGYCYGPEGSALSRCEEIAIPYTTLNPDVRIMLRQGESLEEKLPGPDCPPPQLDGRQAGRWRKFICASLARLHELCELFDEELPGFLPVGTCGAALREAAETVAASGARLTMLEAEESALRHDHGAATRCRDHLKSLTKEHQALSQAMGPQLLALARAQREAAVQRLQRAIDQIAPQAAAPCCAANNG